MSFRWFGKSDHIPLQYIKQIPGMKNIVSALSHIPVGEVWPYEEIVQVKQQIEAVGLTFKTVESVNVHEDIKRGLPTRDKYIENYCTTLRNLAKAGITVVCYNFMPVFDWTRTDLAKVLDDGSTTMAYDESVLRSLTPERLIQEKEKGSNGFPLPGWEMDRLAEIQKLIKSYDGLDEEALFANLEYFLKGIIPTAEECGIKMAIHPDDPPWSVFGLPRIAISKANLERIVRLVDSPANGLTLCSGSLAANPDNDVVEIFQHFGRMGKIHFAHVRNITIEEPGVFYETAHKSEGATPDLYGVMKALYETGYEGPLRPDHGRMIWGERGLPGYGLYDRALGALYLYGLWDAMVKSNLARGEGAHE